MAEGFLGEAHRGVFALPSALPIRADLSPVALRRLARRERDGRGSARLLALAHALEGMPREEAAPVLPA